jgi:hypothetical protein
MRKSTRIIIFGLFIFIFSTSCLGQNDVIKSNIKSFYVGHKSFLLLKDSTFHYVFYDMGYRYSYGEYKVLTKDIIFFKSKYNLENEIDIDVCEFPYEEDFDSLRVLIKNTNIDKDNFIFYFCLNLADSLVFQQKIMLDSESLVFNLPNKKFDNIQLFFYKNPEGFVKKSTRYYVKQTNCNSLTITLDLPFGAFDSYRMFDNFGVIKGKNIFLAGNSRISSFKRTRKIANHSHLIEFYKNLKIISKY